MSSILIFAMNAFNFKRNILTILYFGWFKCIIFKMSKSDCQLLYQNFCQRISVIPENCHFDSRFVLRQQKHHEILWRTFWRNNWWSIFDFVKILRYSQYYIVVKSIFCPNSNYYFSKFKSVFLQKRNHPIVLLVVNFVKIYYVGVQIEMQIENLNTK